LFPHIRNRTNQLIQRKNQSKTLRRMRILKLIKINKILIQIRSKINFKIGLKFMIKMRSLLINSILNRVEIKIHSRLLQILIQNNRMIHA